MIFTDSIRTAVPTTAGTIFTEKVLALGTSIIPTVQRGITTEGITGEGTTVAEVAMAEAATVAEAATAAVMAVEAVMAGTSSGSIGTVCGILAKVRPF